MDFQRGAAAGARLVKAPFLSGGAEGPAWAQRDGRGADKSVRVLMMLRAGRRAVPGGVYTTWDPGAPQLCGWGQYGQRGVLPEADLLAWLDMRTELGFEVATDELASGRIAFHRLCR